MFIDDNLLDGLEDALATRIDEAAHDGATARYSRPSFRSASVPEIAKDFSETSRSYDAPPGGWRGIARPSTWRGTLPERDRS